jgi:hypothetical protein
MVHSDGEVEAVDDFPWWRLVGHRSGHIEPKSAFATRGHTKDQF